MKSAKRRVGTGAQQAVLFLGGPGEPARPTNVCPEPQFIDPDPADLYVGSSPLSEFLRQTGEVKVLAVRRLTRELDLSEFIAAAKGGGRRPYHPALMLGLVWFAFGEGLSSLRAIERFAKTDARAWWLTGGAMPDHATIGRFVLKHDELITGKAFEQLARKIVKIVGERATDVAIDGTTVAAMTRRYRLVTEEAARDHAKEAKQQAAASEGQTKDKLLAKAAAFDRAAEVAHERTEARTEDQGTYRGESKVAETDPEAVYQKLKDGTFAPSYKPVIAATESRIVVGFDVQPSNENKAVGPVLEQAERVAAAPVERARADAGFFTGEVIQTMLDRGVVEPLITDRATAAPLREKKVPKRLPTAAFRYDGAKDEYTCPEGHALRFLNTRPLRHTTVRTYGGAPCSKCPRRAECTTGKSPRTIVRGASTDLLEAMSHCMAYPHNVAQYKRRAAMVEPVFADLLQKQRLRRFLRRGLKGARLEFALHAAAHNLGRLMARLAAGGADALAGLLTALLGLLAWLRAVWASLLQLPQTALRQVASQHQPCRPTWVTRALAVKTP